MRDQKFWWKRSTCRTGCVMCAAYPVSKEIRKERSAELFRLQAHHIIPQRVLKREGKAHMLWVEGNGMCLCEYHHQRHENWTQRVPRHLVTKAAEEFAAYVGLDYLLDRDYPEDEHGRQEVTRK